MHSIRTASTALENVKKRPPRLSLSKVRNLFPIGKCLRRKISERPYSAYSVECPRCLAGAGYKCVGVRGVLSPIPHFPREREAARIYREGVTARLRSERLRRVEAGEGRRGANGLGVDQLPLLSGNNSLIACRDTSERHHEKQPATAQGGHL
jgi:hypothetical protein